MILMLWTTRDDWILWILLIREDDWMFLMMIDISLVQYLGSSGNVLLDPSSAESKIVSWRSANYINGGASGKKRL